MMEAIMTQKVTPLLKCFVLFLFIFTAKVLTSRPNEVHDSANGIQHVKPAHYVRTFTKYHHRRTIQWNDLQNYWPATQEQPKTFGKRSVTDWPKIIRKRNEVPYSNHYKRNKRNVQIPDSNEFVGQSNSGLIHENQNFEKNAISSGKEDHSTKNELANDVKKYKVKAAIVITDPPTTTGPTISCLYKIHRVAKSVTPSYSDDADAQFMVENVSFGTGTITETELPSGPTQIEKCTDPKATCYTLWHQDNEGNITVLGQGCWRSSTPQSEDRKPCDKCTVVTARLLSAKFCCCTKSYCNADFTSLPVETITMKAESTMEVSPASSKYSNLVASAILVLASLLVMAAMLHKMYCNKVEVSEDIEKGEVMGSGPDALATGLLCVDNLTLIEHIGQGKFGSVWRGSLGSTPVAVKLYSNASTWQKEAAIYALPHLSHSNILRYYGSDTRPTLTEGGGREHLIVLELCSCTLRARLERAPLSWLEFATFAHGISSALSHLHTPAGNKPCIVHRDVNSNNVLVSGDGSCRLADLGLAQSLRPRSGDAAPTRYTEAGTLRYLAPEALEGALDLSGAGAALCAVDVFALALVLWELLWRTAPAHRGGRAPPYAPPYHRALPPAPSLTQMQSLVSRNKARPPLPTGPVPEWRVLKIASDTCEECWDHDAEARLTAVCVEERMSELKQLVSAQPPHIHDNKLQPPPMGDAEPPETEKQCNVEATCDVTTPLLARALAGRNACLARNSLAAQPAPAPPAPALVARSLKDCAPAAGTPHPRPSSQYNSLAAQPAPAPPAPALVARSLKDCAPAAGTPHPRPSSQYNSLAAQPAPAPPAPALVARSLKDCAPAAGTPHPRPSSQYNSLAAQPAPAPPAPALVARSLKDCAPAAGTPHPRPSSQYNSLAAQPAPAPPAPALVARSLKDCAPAAGTPHPRPSSQYNSLAAQPAPAPPAPALVARSLKDCAPAAGTPHPRPSSQYNSLAAQPAPAPPAPALVARSLKDCAPAAGTPHPRPSSQYNSLAAQPAPAPPAPALVARSLKDCAPAAGTPHPRPSSQYNSLAAQPAPAPPAPALVARSLKDCAPAAGTPHPRPSSQYNSLAAQPAPAPPAPALVARSLKDCAPAAGTPHPRPSSQYNSLAAQPAPAPPAPALVARSLKDCAPAAGTPHPRPSSQYNSLAAQPAPAPPAPALVARSLKDCAPAAGTPHPRPSSQYNSLAAQPAPAPPAPALVARSLKDCAPAAGTPHPRPSSQYNSLAAQPAPAPPAPALVARSLKDCAPAAGTPHPRPSSQYNSLAAQPAPAPPAPALVARSLKDCAPAAGTPHPRPSSQYNSLAAQPAPAPPAPALVARSLKDCAPAAEPSRQNIEENCLSVARISHRIPIQENSLNEIRSYPRPLDYVPNDVTFKTANLAPKQTNLLQDVKVEKPRWGIRKFFQKLNRKETEVKLLPESSQRTRTSIIDQPMNLAYERPSNLTLDEERERYYEQPCLSPPNMTLSPNMMEQRFKELPPREHDPKVQNLIFAVIVPKAQIHDNRKKNSLESIHKSVRTSMSSQSMFKSNSESEDSTVKKRLSDNKITNSASSSRASINLELQYMDNTENFNPQVSPFDVTDTSSSEDENLMLLSENGGSKITMTPIPKEKDILKESSQTKSEFTINKQNKYSNFDNEYSDPNDKENLATYSVDNPLYLAALNGDISTDTKLSTDKQTTDTDKPKPCLKSLSIKRQHSLEQVSDLFSSAGDLNLLNPAGRVKTPGDLPVAVRRARSRALQKSRASESNRLSLYDDRMMFGNSL